MASICDIIFIMDVRERSANKPHHFLAASECSINDLRDRDDVLFPFVMTAEDGDKSWYTTPSARRNSHDVTMETDVHLCTAGFCTYIEGELSTFIKRR